MRIVHLADTHLGFSAYNKVDPSTGLNQREVDVYSAFNEIIDYILQTKPDLVVHAGDLFDSVRPSNRAIHEAFRQFVRLSKAEIPTVIIAGNHSTPRQKVTGSIFRLLQYLDHVYPVFEGEYKTIEIGDAKIHAIPHAYNEAMLKDNFTKLKPDKSFRHNILVTHATVIGTNAYAGAEFKEQSIPPSVLSPDFDYIALGHIHKFTKVAENAYYSGSPERLSFSESGYDKGFLDVELGSRKVRQIKTSAREMLDLPPIDCSRLDASQVMKSVESILPADISGKILRLTFQDIPHDVYSSLDLQKIDELTAPALHCEKQRIFKKSDSAAAGGGQIGAIAEEFAAFVKMQPIDVKTQSALAKIGMGYLEDAMQEVEEE